MISHVEKRKCIAHHISFADAFRGLNVGLLFCLRTFVIVLRQIMAIFFSKDVHELLENKKVVVIGDSIQRSVYKDLVCLWTQSDSRYLFQKELRAKGELSFLGDKLLHGGKLDGKMVNGIGYREVREFSDEKAFFKYYFVTRSYSEHMASILNELKTHQPDVIVMNSTFWDLHHYGDTDLQQYKENLDKLLKDISEMFVSSLLFIWNAALPLAERCKGGFLRKGFLTIPIDKIKTANKFAWLATTEQKKVYLDLFSELKDKENFQQAEDGIHWGMRAHRKISNLILTEVCTAWNKKIPDPPPQVKRPDNRNSSPVPWSSYYPDNDNWNSSPASLYNDDYELEYYVPYWGSPSYDRYQTPPPLLPSAYSNSWNSVSWGYNLPFGNIAGRAKEYLPVPPQAPYLFQRQYLPIENMQLNFSTPQGPYYPEKYFFKPANYSDPLPSRSFSPLFNQNFRSFQGIGQGLLPTPPGLPSFAYFNEGNRYRDRFKKLSDPRARRYKSSSTNTSAPLSSTTCHTRQSALHETPKNSRSTDQNTKPSAVNSNDNPDHNNNNSEQKGSLNESCSKINGDSIDVGTGGPSVDAPKLPTSVGNSTEGSSDSAMQTSDSAQGVKRKREDDDDSNPCKVAREECTEAQRSGVKRKHEDDRTADEPKPLKKVHEDSYPLVDDAVDFEIKRSCGEDGAGEKPNLQPALEGSSTEGPQENQAEEQGADKVNSPANQAEEQHADKPSCPTNQTGEQGADKPNSPANPAGEQCADKSNSPASQAGEQCADKLNSPTSVSQGTCCDVRCALSFDSFI